MLVQTLEDTKETTQKAPDIATARVQASWIMEILSGHRATSDHYGRAKGRLSDWQADHKGRKEREARKVNGGEKR